MIAQLFFRPALMLRSTVLILLSVALVLLSMGPVRAQGLLRDPDIEYALNQLAAPVLRAAGLSSQRVKILMVNDSRLNAFVVDTNAIYVNYGLILKMERPEVFQAVVAHEAAHISNGHLTRRMANMRSARTLAGLGVALAAVAAASGGGEAAGGIALGTQSAALRSFLAHTRAEEASADQSAVRYLRSARVDPRGLLDVHEIFHGQELLAGGRQDPYMRSHPLTRDRIRAAEAFVNANPGNFGDNPTAQYWYARARGKLSAFTRAPRWTLRRVNDSPSRDIKLMREAVAYHRQSNARRATRAIDQAIALRPQDPFLYELKGQILLESRQVAPALAAYQRAAQLAPGDTLIQASLGRAQVVAGQYQSAVRTLERARSRDFRNNQLLRDLATAYARTGQNGMASLLTAERYALQGRLQDAEIHAKRAEGLLSQGSGPWRRAQDVLAAASRQ